MSGAFALFHSFRGQSHFFRKKYPEAIKSYTSALELKPEVRHFLIRSISYYKTDQLDLAIEDCTNALEMEPGNSSAYLQRGHLLLQQENYEEALSDLLEVEDTVMYLPIIRILRGITYRKLGKYDLSLIDLNELLASKPTHTKAYYERACVHRELQQEEEAKSDFEKFLLYAEAQKKDKKDTRDVDLFEKEIEEAKKYLAQSSTE